MNLSEIIKSVETKWILPAEKFFNTCFDGIWLPSHDFGHHLRVWGYAKEQMFGFSRKEVEFTPEFIEALCIAGLMHDVGLSKTFDESHGKASAELTKKFLLEHPLSSDLFYNEMLEAILLHDDKSYLNEKANMDHPGLYQILTVADDMDAFGYLGAFRYIEIYGRRNVPAMEMTAKILKNINNRFMFVSSRLQGFPIVYKTQEERFENSLEVLNSISVNQVEELLGYFIKHVELKDVLGQSSYVMLKNWLRLAAERQN